MFSAKLVYCRGRFRVVRETKTNRSDSILPRACRPGLDVSRDPLRHSAQRQSAPLSLLLLLLLSILIMSRDGTHNTSLELFGFRRRSAVRSGIRTVCRRPDLFAESSRDRRRGDRRGMRVLVLVDLIRTRDLYSIYRPLRVTGFVRVGIRANR